MKKILFLVLLVFTSIFASQRILISACDQPILFRTDQIDSKFNLSEEKFVQNAKKAADIWNKALNKQFLVMDPQGKLSINLLYDERQSLSSKLNTLEGQIEKDRKSLDPKLAAYESDVSKFNAAVRALNDEINQWNEKGGAPPEVYKQLIDKQKALEQEANRLTNVAKNLKLATGDFNTKIDSLNKTAGSLNLALSERPEEGIYISDQNRIEVYFYVNEDELVHTLAHEMGHAIGLTHNENPNSLMYSQTNQSLTLSPQDQSDLAKVCAKRSLYELMLQKIKTIEENMGGVGIHATI